MSPGPFVPSLDITRTPLSRAGSYLSLMVPPRTPSLGPGLYLQSHLSKVAANRYVALIELLEHNQMVLPTSMSCSPEELVLHAPSGGRIRVCIPQCHTLRIKGEGAGLRFRVPTPWGVVAQPVDERRWSLNARHAYSHYMFEVLTGRLSADAPWAPQTCPRIVLDIMPDEHGNLDAAVDTYQSTWVEYPRHDYATALTGVAREFEDFCVGMPRPADNSLLGTWRHACYILWSSLVSPYGWVRRPVMFMSKVVMDQVWSWDHCFNAMACFHGQRELAWSQFMFMYDHQDEYGALPDAVDCLFRQYNYAKPPVHGWALAWMTRQEPEFFDHARLDEVYPPLLRQSRWWSQHRTRAQDRLPHYQHGHDGWDNSTMFDAGAPLLAPDLAALLILQYCTLANIANRLGLPDEAREHERTAESLLDALIQELWRDDHFVARRLADGFEIHCQSLITCIPIILGRRLPIHVQNALVRQLHGFLTEYGLASEHPKSPLYQPDGYWRGPIWAPCTMMIVDGLTDIGQYGLAATIARRFGHLCAGSGFAENFNAMTGQGLRDSAYTWTASTFLILTHQYHATAATTSPQRHAVALH